MPKFLISPTEHDLAEKLGDDALTSSIPEEKGADILIYTKQGLYGAQRKAIPHDFISSVKDGRLTRACTLLTKECKMYELICEGKFRYYPDGSLVVSKKVPSSFTRRQIRGILFDVKFIRGVPVEYTEDIDDTVRYLQWIHKSLSEHKHLSLFSRPALQGTWYVPSVGELHSWILQSWPGIGPATSENIVKQFGHIPLKWTCTLEQLESVPKLGRKKAKELYDTFNMVGDKAQIIGPVNVKQPAVDSDFDNLRKLLHHE